MCIKYIKYIASNVYEHEQSINEKLYFYERKHLNRKEVIRLYYNITTYVHTVKVITEKRLTYVKFTFWNNF